jgi:hypothetical protein
MYVDKAGMFKSVSHFWTAVGQTSLLASSSITYVKFSLTYFKLNLIYVKFEFNSTCIRHMSNSSRIMYILQIRIFNRYMLDIANLS